MMRRSGPLSRGGVLGVALLLLLTLLVPSAGAIEDSEAATLPGSSATRVLIVGDSLTQGHAGDWTWRYFAWRHLTDSGARVDFVGPEREPHVPYGASWPATYFDPAFDQDHAARWGDSFGFPITDQWGTVRALQPDVVVVALGANDVGGFQRSAPAVLESARAWVAQARADSPGVDVVLMDIPWTNHPVAVRYNALLGQVVKDLDRPDGRVLLARASSGYVMGRDDDSGGDTWDQIHPNAQGQLKIGAAVCDALSQLGLGTPYPRPLPRVLQGPRIAPTLRDTSTKRAVQISWVRPATATSVDVWTRTPAGAWRRLVRAWVASRLGLPGLRTCRTRQFRVVARTGWTPASAEFHSAILTTRLGRSVTRAPRPRVTAGPGAVSLRWKSVPGACAYRIRWRYTQASGRVRVREVVTRRPRNRVSRLRAGTRARARVTALGAHGAGPMSRVAVVRVPGNP